MRPESRTRIFDAIRAIEAVGEFIEGKTDIDYDASSLLQSAVERQLTIIGEALSVLRKDDPSLAERIPDLPAAIGLRNVLVHGYEAIDDAVMWRTVTHDLVPLLRHLRELIGE